MLPYGARVHGRETVLVRRGRGPAGRALVALQRVSHAAARASARREIAAGRLDPSLAETAIEARDAFDYATEAAPWGIPYLGARHVDAVGPTRGALQRELVRVLNPQCSEAA
jgi:hypothetical protein